MAVYKRPSGTAAKTKSAPKDTKEEDTSQPSEVPTAEAPAETPTEGEKANTEKEKPTEKDTKEEKDTGGDLASQLSKTESLEQKLQLVRSQDMPLNEKLELLNRSLDLKEWNKLNGRFNTAKKRSAEVAEVGSCYAPSIPGKKNTKSLYCESCCEHGHNLEFSCLQTVRN